MSSIEHRALIEEAFAADDYRLLSKLSFLDVLRGAETPSFLQRLAHETNPSIPVAVYRVLALPEVSSRVATAAVILPLIAASLSPS